MAFPIAKARNDVAREDAGEWVDLPSFEGVRAHVRSFQSEYVQKVGKKLRARYKVELERGGEATAEANTRVYLGMLRAAVIEVAGFDVEWAELADRVFDEAPASRREWRDLLNDLGSAAASAGEVDRVVLDEAGKELPPLSGPVTT